MTYVVPLELARDAFVADEIDDLTFEAMISAAFEGREVEVPFELQHRVYSHLQLQVRFSPGLVNPVSRVRFV